MIFAYPSNDGFNGGLARKSFQTKKEIDLGLGGDHVLQEATRYYFNGFEHKQILSRVVKGKLIHNQDRFKTSFK